MAENPKVPMAKQAPSVKKRKKPIKIYEESFGSSTEGNLRNFRDKVARAVVKRPRAVVKRPRAGVDIRKMKEILDIRGSSTEMMRTAFLHIRGIAGGSSAPVQTSGGDGSLCTTDGEKEGARSKGKNLSVEEGASSPSGDASNMQAQGEEFVPSDATRHASYEANTSHHADLASSPSSNSNGAVTPPGTLPVKWGSKFMAVLSAPRIRKQNFFCYIMKKDRALTPHEQSYEKHVLKGETNGNPKVTIEGTSVTAEQFVNSLKEGGEETEEFVDVCIKAMTTDWKDEKKTTSLIIDRPTVVKILDDNCTPEFIDEYLRKEANLELLERIYILLNNNDQWVLCIMSLNAKFEVLHIFCPTVNALERENIHGNVIKNVVGKLQRSLVRLQLEYTKDKMRNKRNQKPTLLFNLKNNTHFRMKFPDESAVQIKRPGDHTGNHGGVFIYLLRLIEDHLGADISKCEVPHEVLLGQKKRLTHLLVHHWLNSQISGAGTGEASRG